MRKTLLFLFSALIALAACESQQPSAHQASTSSADRPRLESMLWLQQRLPANTLAYARIPTMWNVFMENNNDALGQALANDAHRRLVTELRTALHAHYLAVLPPESKSAAEWLLMNVDAPMEVALFSLSEAYFIPALWFSLSLRDDGRGQVEALMQAMQAAAGGALVLTQALDAAGRAQFSGPNGVAVHVFFDADGKRLHVFGGLNARVEKLDELIAAKHSDAALQTVLEYEHGVDERGAGIALWVRVAALYQYTQAYLNPAQQGLLKNLAIDQIKFLWLGNTARNGHAGLKMHLRMPDIGFRLFLPRVDETSELHTAGPPTWVFQMALPTLEQVHDATEFLAAARPDGEQLRHQVETGLKADNDLLWMSAETFLNTYGPKFWYVNDDSGSWMALKLRNPEAHRQMLQTAVEAGAIHTQHTVSGVSIHRLQYQEDLLQMLLDMGLESLSQSRVLQALQQHNRTNIYWIEQDGHLISASVPQVLIDYATHPDRRRLSAWQEERDDLDWRNAVLAVSSWQAGRNQDLYNSYLSVLQYLVNLSGAQADMLALPTARQLGLSDQGGRFAAAVHSDHQGLSVSLDYQYTALEMFSMGTYGTVAVAGILAAYAIPAYRDYTVRAKIGEKKAYMAGMKSQISQTLLSSETPKAEDFDDLIPGISLYEDASKLGLWLDLSAIEGEDLDDYFMLQYLQQNGQAYSLKWRCLSNLPDRLRGPDCEFADDVPE